jgi:hypothetical protein
LSYLVIGRGCAYGMPVAPRYGGRALTSDQFGDAVVRSDIVISSSGAPCAIA